MRDQVVSWDKFNFTNYYFWDMFIYRKPLSVEGFFFTPFGIIKNDN